MRRSPRTVLDLDYRTLLLVCALLGALVTGSLVQRAEPRLMGLLPGAVLDAPVWVLQPRHESPADTSAAPFPRQPAAPALPPQDSSLVPTLPMLYVNAPVQRVLQRAVVKAFDYSDPAGGEAVPLIRVAGQEDLFLSPHFRVSDFAARDGAPYARISFELVDALEQLRTYLEAPIHINSGYRHPALNFDPDVGGAARSQHMAGLAADIASAERTPLELATAALDVIGCDIGLGLGADFIHLDLRGYLSTWVSAEAALDEAAFDDWVLGQCFGEEPEEHPDAADAPLAGPAADDSTLAETYQAEMAAYARVQLRRGVPGAVLLDLRNYTENRDASLAYQISFIPLESPVARRYDLTALIQRFEHTSYFVYVILGPAGDRHVGVTSYLDPDPKTSGVLLTGRP